MHVLAIPGSVRRNSYNLALLQAMKDRAPGGTEITIFDRMKEIPLFDPDICDEALPESVERLMASIRASDGVIISTPEYAHGVPGALKNALDWLVASDAMILKPVVVTSVSTSSLGGVRSHSPLLLILSAMNANVVVEGSLNVPFASKKFRADNHLEDKLTERAIDLSLSALEQAVSLAS